MAEPSTLTESVSGAISSRTAMLAAGARVCVLNPEALTTSFSSGLPGSAMRKAPSGPVTVCASTADAAHDRDLRVGDGLAGWIVYLTLELGGAQAGGKDCETG